MIRNDFRNPLMEQKYASPEVVVYSVKAEGVLCLSGKSNQLPDVDEEDWGDLE